MTSNPSAPMSLFVGTYTQNLPHVQGKASGIPVYRIDQASGRLDEMATRSGTENPSYLALHPTQPLLYAVNELEEGGVSAFRIDPDTGHLTFLDQQASHGGSPAHISVDHTGRWVLVANYENGSVAILPIRGDGGLDAATDVVQHHGHSVNPERQQGPHAHCIKADPSNRFVLVADLGLDKIMVYRLDTEAGKLIPNDPPAAAMQPGSGPRHIEFHPNGRWVYVINEINSTLVTCTYDAEQGILTPIQDLSTLPEGFTGSNTTAAVRVAPSGRFIYGSNRGHDSIAIFAVDPDAGTLTLVDRVPTQGKSPRDFNIDPSGAFLYAANQDSDTIVAFRVDQQTGRLTPTGQHYAVQTPVCIQVEVIPRT